VRSVSEKERSTPRACCRATGEACVRRHPGLDKAAALFKALADETRLAILKQLREQGEVCACDLQACCELAQPTVSHHLKVLRRAGLVRAEKRGLWVYYTLDEQSMEALRGLIP
jgi:ArsR family transcriptional regulator